MTRTQVETAQRDFAVELIQKYFQVDEAAARQDAIKPRRRAPAMRNDEIVKEIETLLKNHGSTFLVTPNKLPSLLKAALDYDVRSNARSTYINGEKHVCLPRLIRRDYMPPAPRESGERLSSV